MLGRKRGGSAASSASGGTDSFKDYKWDRSHSEVGDTLRYFNAFHSSKSWCCVGDSLKQGGLWLERDLLISGEDFERLKNVESVESPIEMTSNGPNKKSVSILLTMPSTDLDDIDERTTDEKTENEMSTTTEVKNQMTSTKSVLATTQQGGLNQYIANDQSRKSFPSKSALKTPASSSVIHLASNDEPAIEEVSSSKRRSASLEPRVSFNIDEKDVDAISRISVDKELHARGDSKLPAFVLDHKCCHLCGRNEKVVVKSPTSAKTNFRKLLNGDRPDSAICELEDEKKFRSKRRRPSVFGFSDNIKTTSAITTAAVSTGLSAASAVRCYSPSSSSPAVVFINSPISARVGRPTFGRMDPALERIHVSLMSSMGQKYVTVERGTSLADKIFTGGLIALTVVAVIVLFWYQNFGPGFGFKHVTSSS